MTRTETLALKPGTKVYCTVHGSEGWSTLLDVRHRDGYIKISGFNMWCPPFNFTLEPFCDACKQHKPCSCDQMAEDRRTR